MTHVMASKHCPLFVIFVCERAPIPCGASRWNQLNIGSTIVRWLNMYGNMWPISFGHSLPVRGTLAHRSHFQC